MILKFNHRRLQLALVTALCLLAAVGAYYATYRKHNAATHLATVQRGSFEVRIQTVGLLDAQSGFQVASQLRGDKGKIIEIASDGTFVAEGDLLLRFDPTFFESEISRLEGELKSREAVAESAKQHLEIEKSQADMAVSNAQFDLKKEKQEYARYLAYLGDLSKLRSAGHAVQSEVEQAQRKSEQIFTQLQRMEAGVSRLEQEVLLKIAQAAAELKKAQGEAETARMALTDAKTELGKTRVVAPLSGFVVLRDLHIGGQKRKPRVGDAVFQGQPLLYLPQLSDMVVKTKVREEDLGKMKPGQEAQVSVDAYPDLSLKGTVSHIGVLAMEAADATAVGKQFEYLVQLKGTEQRLRPGMTARVQIVSNRVQNALVIPLTSIFNDKNQNICYVLSDGALQPVQVTIGRTNEDFAEVLSGLTEGQQVSLVQP